VTVSDTVTMLLQMCLYDVVYSHCKPTSCPSYLVCGDYKANKNWSVVTIRFKDVFLLWFVVLMSVLIWFVILIRLH